MFIIKMFQSRSILISLMLVIHSVECHENILDKLSDNVNLNNVFDWVFGEADETHEIEEHYGYLRDGKEKIADLAAAIGIKPDFLNFKAHDFDNNDLIDGLELYTVISNEKSDNTARMNRAEHSQLCTKIIDRLLQDEDVNNDGFLDFGEYSRARNRLAH